MATDFKEIKRWFSNNSEVPETVKTARNAIDDLNLEKIDRVSNSVYKGIMCLIALKGAKDFLRGDTLEFNVLDDHHIFPKSQIKKYYAGQKINSILNKTLIAEKTNREYIWKKTPPEYLNKIMKEQNINKLELSKRLDSHLIPEEAFEYLLRDDFNGFLDKREDLIKEEIKKRLGL